MMRDINIFVQLVLPLLTFAASTIMAASPTITRRPIPMAFVPLLQMSQWYTTQTERKATLTDFSLASRCYYDNTYKAGYYYLRSIGSSASYVCFVYYGGSFDYSTRPTSSTSGLRPAFALRDSGFISASARLHKR